MNISREKMESARKFWANVAKANGWYAEPFHIQVWVNGTGDIVNSLSFKGLDRDVALDTDDNEIIGFTVS